MHTNFSEYVVHGNHERWSIMLKSHFLSIPEGTDDLNDRWISISVSESCKYVMKVSVTQFYHVRVWAQKDVH